MQSITDIPQPPPRPDGAHKGTFGTVIVVGGSQTMLGAPAIASRAALRSGAGLVKVACASSILPHVLTIEPSATGIALDASRDTADAQRRIEQADPQAKAVLAIGPGLGQSETAGELVITLLRGSHAAVLDADGLNLLAKNRLALQSVQTRTAPLILTPHPGEYRRLAEALGIDADPTDPDQRPDAAAQLAQALGAVVVLKGQHTVVSDADRFAINQTGNPALATAGSGDVLTGLVASLLAQGLEAFDAARLAAHVHGLAADSWAKRHGKRGLRALELADELPEAFASLDA